jgi:hypothetical protein
MSALVIKAWKAEKKPIDSQNNFVSIYRREGGLIAWLLSLMGIDPMTTITIGLERLGFTSASLAGSASKLISLEAICSTFYGYHKPWKAAASMLAVSAILSLLLSSAGAHGVAGVVLLIGVAVALIYYFLNRTLTLGFIEDSGVPSAIQFKRSGSRISISTRSRPKRSALSCRNLSRRSENACCKRERHSSLTAAYRHG